jgi:hypothetical protein
MTCTVEQRRRAEHAAAVLQARPQVLDVAAVGPGADPTARWVVDVVLADDVTGFGPQLCHDAYCWGLTVRQVAPQSEWWQALLVV